ncbi:MAG: helix-turn-helix domain-containing protein, partial [Sulfurovum sp.]
EKSPTELAAELQRLFSKAKDKQERNKLILKAYEQGYSQHMIAKVLGITQQAVYGVIKRGRN